MTTTAHVRIVMSPFPRYLWDVVNIERQLGEETKP